MDFKTFLDKLGEKGWGVAAFNTYRQGGENHYFVVVSQRGGEGWFIKREGLASEIEDVFSDIINDLGDALH